MKKLLNKFKQILLSIDFFSTEVSFTYKKYSKFSTITGSICSIFIFIITLLLLILYLKRISDDKYIILKSKTQLLENTDKLSILKTPSTFNQTIEIKSTGDANYTFFPLAIGFTNANNGSFVNNSYWSQFAEVKFQEISYKSRESLTISNLRTTTCSHLGSINIQDVGVTDVSYLTCLNSQFEISIYQNFKFSSYMDLEVVKCDSNVVNNNCRSDDEILSFFENHYFQLYPTSRYINITNIDNSYINSSNEYYFEFLNGYTKEYKGILSLSQLTEIKRHYPKILFPEKKITTVPKFTLSKGFISSNDQDTLLRIRFSLSKEIEVYERKSQEIIEIITSIASCIFVLYLIISPCISWICSTEFYIDVMNSVYNVIHPDNYLLATIPWGKFIKENYNKQIVQLINEEENARKNIKDNRDNKDKDSNDLVTKKKVSFVVNNNTKGNSNSINNIITEDDNNNKIEMKVIDPNVNNIVEIDKFEMPYDMFNAFDEESESFKKIMNENNMEFSNNNNNTNNRDNAEYIVEDKLPIEKINEKFFKGELVVGDKGVIQINTSNKNKDHSSLKDNSVIIENIELENLKSDNNLSERDSHKIRIITNRSIKLKERKGSSNKDIDSKFKKEDDKNEDKAHKKTINKQDNNEQDQDNKDHEKEKKANTNSNVNCKDNDKSDKSNVNPFMLVTKSSFSNKTVTDINNSQNKNNKNNNNNTNNTNNANNTNENNENNNDIKESSLSASFSSIDKDLNAKKLNLLSTKIALTDEISVINSNLKSLAKQYNSLRYNIKDELDFFLKTDSKLNSSISAIENYFTLERIEDIYGITQMQRMSYINTIKYIIKNKGLMISNVEIEDNLYDEYVERENERINEMKRRNKRKRVNKAKLAKRKSVSVIKEKKDDGNSDSYSNDDFNNNDNDNDNEKVDEIDKSLDRVKIANNANNVNNKIKENKDYSINNESSNIEENNAQPKPKNNKNKAKYGTETMSSFNKDKLIKSEELGGNSTGKLRKLKENKAKKLKEDVNRLLINDFFKKKKQEIMSEMNENEDKAIKDDKKENFVIKESRDSNVEEDFSKYNQSLYDDNNANKGFTNDIENIGGNDINDNNDIKSYFSNDVSQINNKNVNNDPIIPIIPNIPINANNANNTNNINNSKNNNISNNNSKNNSFISIQKLKKNLTKVTQFSQTPTNNIKNPLKTVNIQKSIKENSKKTVNKKLLRSIQEAQRLKKLNKTKINRKNTNESNNSLHHLINNKPIELHIPNSLNEVDFYFQFFSHKKPTFKYFISKCIYQSFRFINYDKLYFSIIELLTLLCCSSIIKLLRAQIRKNENNDNENRKIKSSVCICECLDKFVLRCYDKIILFETSKNKYSSDANFLKLAKHNEYLDNLKTVIFDKYQRNVFDNQVFENVENDSNNNNSNMLINEKNIDDGDDKGMSSKKVITIVSEDKKTDNYDSISNNKDDKDINIHKNGNDSNSNDVSHLNNSTTLTKQEVDINIPLLKEKNDDVKFFEKVITQKEIIDEKIKYIINIIRKQYRFNKEIVSDLELIMTADAVIRNLILSSKKEDMFIKMLLKMGVDNKCVNSLYKFIVNKGMKASIYKKKYQKKKELLNSINKELEKSNIS